ncbi:MAG: undecaprenyl-diphosphate phosphatase [Dysgonamonadaceae bacterium]|jgi:undecaprenyl-diphosphatase|nr:undecaprenyl-diphosphate phosphatase [Dysgonamonadaceae bacterium]MDD3494419.1 undecaprenyl-diphosphate phosphatase [Dysgonamonadaceae bacterium]MDD4378855.1 undecaprenyl-diphosphate phosphatase [Dysgonamonadaceae bacterium]NLH30172.1 undecaprenyl-diphosphate phosphatase [Bacteroidales bacterium]
MNSIEAIVIAIVEGLTEFLPVSSTGHMIITQALLGIESTPFVKAFTVIIQFGAILAVVVLYWQRFFRLKPVKIRDPEAVKGRSTWEKWGIYVKRFLDKFDFYLKLLIALVPAGVLGLLLGDQIDSLLENVLVVAIMLVAGGIVMLFVDQWFDKPTPDQTVTWQKALKIGCFQCIAMIPGVSRSFATIVGGMSVKLDRKNAAEFSFFLAVPTMAAAAGYKLYQLMKDPIGMPMLHDNLSLLLIGNIVAFLVAVIAIRFFIDFITRHGFKAFGYYRIIIGGLMLILLSTGTISNII